MKTKHMQFSILKDKYKDYLFIIIFLLCLSVFLFSETLFLGKEFGWYNDQVFQYNIFYKEWYEIIKETLNNKIVSPYSWNLFLGTDFYVSKLFTVTGDLFALIVFILFDIENFNVFFAIETILCILISSVTIKAFIDELGMENRKFVISISIIYALGGFAILFMGSYMFHRFYSLMPLIFLYVERYINNKSVKSFPIIVALLFMQNYELMFSLSLYLVIYFIVSYKLKNNNENLISIIKKAFKLILYYLIGILLVGFAVVPLLMFLKTSSRVGNFDFGNVFWDLDVLVGFLSNMFFPPYNMRTENPPYLFFTERYFGFEYSIYITPIILFAFILLIKKATKLEKRIFFTSEILILLFLFIRPLNMIVHGFSEPTFRWSLILIIHHIFIVVYVFKKYTYSDLYFKEISLFICVFLMIFFLNILIKSYDFENVLNSILIVIFLSLLCYLYSYYLCKNIDFGMLIMTLTTIAFFVVTNISNLKLEFNNHSAFTQEYIDYFINEDEDKMFRYHFDSKEIRPFNYLNLNNSLMYRYLGTTTYDSAYEYVLNDFLQKNNINDWIIDLNDFDLMRMLGVKYIGAVDDLKVDNNQNLEYVYNLDELKVYKIKDYNHIGHTYTNFIKESDYKNNIDWNNELIIKDEDFDLIKDVVDGEKNQLNVIEYNRQFMRANIHCEEKQVLLIAIPYSDGWNVFDQNNNILRKINVQGGFMGIIIDESISEIKMYYATPGLKKGIVVSIIGLILYFTMIMLDKKTDNYLGG